jgi:hypothetical protein
MTIVIPSKARNLLFSVHLLRTYHPPPGHPDSHFTRHPERSQPIPKANPFAESKIPATCYINGSPT